MSASTSTVTDQRRWSSVVLGKIRSLWSLRGLLGLKKKNEMFLCVLDRVCALKLIRKHIINNNNIVSP